VGKKFATLEKAEQERVQKDSDEQWRFFHELSRKNVEIRLPTKEEERKREELHVADKEVKGS
jgi:hypothetical protein